MRRVDATGTCERDKHEDRPDDTDMRVLSEPDNKVSVHQGHARLATAVARADT